MHQRLCATQQHAEAPISIQSFNSAKTSYSMTKLTVSMFPVVSTKTKDIATLI